jgi:hypothetical protein
MIFQAEGTSDVSIRTETVDYGATEFVVFPNADPNEFGFRHPARVVPTSD